MRPGIRVCLSVALLAFPGVAGAQTDADSGSAEAPAPTDGQPGAAPAVEPSGTRELAPEQDAPSQQDGQPLPNAPAGAPPTDTVGDAPAQRSEGLERPPPAAPASPAPPGPPGPPMASVSASAEPTADTGQEGELPRLSPPFMGVELFASVLGRVSDSSNYQRERGTDMGYGAGLWYEGGDRLALGAKYEYTGLGEGETESRGDYINTEYRVHGLWAAGRAYPYRGSGMGIFATAGVGMTFMRLSSSGTRLEEPTQPSQAFLCRGGSSPNLAFAGGAGVNLDVGTQMTFLSELGATMYRGSSELVDGCAVGLGSVVTVGVKLGFAYNFGV